MKYPCYSYNAITVFGSVVSDPLRCTVGISGYTRCLAVGFIKHCRYLTVDMTRDSRNIVLMTKDAHTCCVCLKVQNLTNAMTLLLLRYRGISGKWPENVLKQYFTRVWKLLSDATNSFFFCHNFERRCLFGPSRYLNIHFVWPYTLLAGANPLAGLIQENKLEIHIKPPITLLRSF